MSVFSGTNLGQATIFGLGIMPYISASIIFQLLGSVYPPLEKLQKEGETGRKKINEYTRYATVFLCLGQSWAYVMWLAASKELINPRFLRDPRQSGQRHAVVLAVYCRLDHDRRNGISHVARRADRRVRHRQRHQPPDHGQYSRPACRSAIGEIVQPILAGGGLELGSGRGQMGVEKLLVLIVLFVGVIAGVVLISQGQRRIPTQSAKHVRGRRVYGGTRQYLPLRVNQAGVMPIIFASSLLLFPMMIFSWLASRFP